MKYILKTNIKCGELKNKNYRLSILKIGQWNQLI